MNRSRQTLLIVAAVLTTAAVFLAVSGGLRTTVGGLRISARSPLPVAVLALVAVAGWIGFAQRARALGSDLDDLFAVVSRRALLLITVVAIMAALMAAAFATRSVAGADASGYVSEAAMLGRGTLVYVDDLADLRRGFDAYLTSPLGWRPSSETEQVPTYPPGLPLLMAIPHAVAGVDGASAVVVVSAALAVMSTGLIAVRLGGGLAGILASVLLAFTPVFLHQAIQPMSDVPVTAAWTLCFLLLQRGGRSDTLAGIACAAAVLIRPNLAPLAMVPLWMAERRVAFAGPVAVAGLGLAALQQVSYGSPFRSGYGATDELFALSNIVPNAGRYAGWMLATAPLTFVGLLGAFRLRRDARARGMLVFAALVIVAYLVYAVFDDWTYLRFLLPASAMFAAFSAAEMVAWLDRVPAVFRLVAAFLAILGMAATGVATARTRDAFKLADQLARVDQVAAFVRSETPAAAVVVAGEQSGSMRYATGRSIVRWEAATPESFGASLSALDRASRPVVIVLDAFEESLFRARLSAVPAAALDWPPAVDAGSSRRTRVWRVADRERFLRGERIDTLRIP